MILLRWGFPAKRLTKYNNNNPIYGLKYVGGESVGRTPVTEESALSIAAFWAGVRLISEKIAEFPTDVVQRQNGSRREIAHPTLKLLNSKANRFSSSFDYTQILIASAIIHGNGYALISRDGSRVEELLNVHPDCVKTIVEDGELYYVLELNDMEDDIVVHNRDIIHIKGFGMYPTHGISLLEQHRINLGLALAARDYGVDVFNKGTRIDGYLKYPGKMDKEVKNAIADSWNYNYGPNGRRSIAILDGDTEYKPLQLKPEDAQFLETRTYSTREIATILGVPPHMLGDMEHATFSNIEHQQREFLSSLLGWIRKLEQEYNSKLLFDNERDNTTFRLNFNSLLRSDTQARAQFYEVLHRISAVTPNEIRSWEDLNPYDGGDEFYSQLNMVQVSKLDDIQDEENSKNG